MVAPIAYIIEDDEKLSEIFAEAVKAAGYETEVISDGQVALDRLQSMPPQLVVLDLHLPNVSGPDILVQMRSNEALKHVRVIVASADDHLATSQEVETAATLVLQKPVRYSQLRLLAERLFPTTG